LETSYIPNEGMDDGNAQKAALREFPRSGLDGRD
jgi:hypothetical protein